MEAQNPEASSPGATIKIKLIGSVISTPLKHKIIVKCLGLRKMNQIVVRPDDANFRGMVKKLPHLLMVVE
jgi:large subunit ribosomal protein L30